MDYASTSPTISPSDYQSTTKVILVRHARTTYNEQGRYQGSSDASVLTAKGHKDAYQTGLALQQFSFDAIYTSPLTRVQQTTKEIIFALQQTTDNFPPVFIEPKLTEIEMSDWQGLSYQAVKEKFPEAYRCWQETPHLFTRDRATLKKASLASRTSEADLAGNHETRPTGNLALHRGLDNRADFPEDNPTFFPVLELFQQAQNFWQEILAKHRGETILVIAHGGTNRALISTAIGLNPEHYHCLQQSNCGISCLEFSAINSNIAQLSYLNVTDHLEENLPKLKAGNRGWRWLILSNQVTKSLLESSDIPEFMDRGLINLILTDDSQLSEALTDKLLKHSNQVVHLPITQDHFLESWQQTIFSRQQFNYSSEESSLITGLIIAPENLICQILGKTLDISNNLDIANQLSVIHYPQANRRSILQGLLPIDKQLVTKLSMPAVG